MSAALAAELAGPDELLKGHEEFGIIAFTAGFARRTCEQAVVRAPMDGQPWHLHIVGSKTDGRKKRFCRGCHVIRDPAPPYPP
jgi:hypothetical protein